MLERHGPAIRTRYPRTTGDLEAEFFTDLNDPKLTIQGLGSVVVREVGSDIPLSNRVEPTIEYRRQPSDLAAEQRFEEAWQRQLGSN